MDNALIQTLIWFIVGGVITVFTQRGASPQRFEAKLNGNGKKRDTGELVMLRHLENAQDERIGSIERWRNNSDERFLTIERRLERLERIELRLAGIEHALALLAVKGPEVKVIAEISQ